MISGERDSERNKNKFPKVIHLSKVSSIDKYNKVKKGKEREEG